MTDSPDIRRKRLLFRSWLRGTREADLILGSFAESHLAGFDEPQLDQFEALLEVPDAELFDITRTGNRHTAFGMGAFYCLGAALARMEADECFRILLDRLPGIRPGYQSLDRDSDSPLGRRLRSLPVEWS